MITDQERERMHLAISMYASLTPEEIAVLADVTAEKAIQYKKEQKQKILMDVRRVEAAQCWSIGFE